MLVLITPQGNKIYFHMNTEGEDSPLFTLVKATGFSFTGRHSSALLPEPSEGQHNLLTSEMAASLAGAWVLTGYTPWQCKQLLHDLDLPLLGEHHSWKKGQAESHKKAKYIYVVCVLLVSLFVVNDLSPSHAFPRFCQLFPNHFTAALTDSPHNTQRQRGKHTFSKRVPLPNA